MAYLRIEYSFILLLVLLTITAKSAIEQMRLRQSNRNPKIITTGSAIEKMRLKQSNRNQKIITKKRTDERSIHTKLKKIQKSNQTDGRTINTKFKKTQKGNRTEKINTNFKKIQNYSEMQHDPHPNKNMTLLSKLPVLPKDDAIVKYRSSFHKNVSCTRAYSIPCLFWMTARNVSQILTVNGTYRWIPMFLNNNTDWQIKIANDTEMEEFMERVFAGTKLLWAFNMINPKLPPARVDIWRYAILWVYGGGYMDTDSYIGTRLTKIVANNDSFIFGSEKRKRQQCYDPTFHLHEDRLRTINISFPLPRLAFAQNIIFSRPGHPFLRRCLENFVELVELAYLRQSPIRGVWHTYLNQELICTTGPMLFTYSIIQEIYHSALSNSSHTLRYKFHIDDKGMKSTSKMLKIKDIPNHYGKIVFSRSKKVSYKFLKQYHDE